MSQTKSAIAQGARGVEWPTLAVFLGTYGGLGAGFYLWHTVPLVAFIILALALTQYSSLQHEVLHGHPFSRQWASEALVFPAFLLVIPYLRFKDTHLAHHYDPALTDPYDDPESNYFDPAVWARQPRWWQRVLLANNTLLGRILLGPAIGIGYFLRGELRLIGAGNRRVILAWALNALGVIPVIWALQWAQMPALAYGAAVYAAIGILRIRTFLEHRAHEAPRARTVIIEDRGPLALLFLNNNYHVVHHMHPNVPWYDLPHLYAQRRDHFLRRNDGYWFNSYGAIFSRYLIRAKDPVAHPIWPVVKTHPSGGDSHPAD